MKDLIARAGGVSAAGADRGYTIIRRVDGQNVRIDVTPETKLQPFDELKIPEKVIESAIPSRRRRAMSAEIDDLVGKFEARRLSAGELVAALAGLVASAGAAATAQEAAVTTVAQGRTINHVSMAVTDVEKAAAFYKALLGLKEVSRPGNGGINLGSRTASSASTSCRIPARSTTSASASTISIRTRWPTS